MLQWPLIKFSNLDTIHKESLRTTHGNISVKKIYISEVRKQKMPISTFQYKLLETKICHSNQLAGAFAIKKHFCRDKNPFCKVCVLSAI